jgi:glycosyltransferase involved in cell wall biosynthesis
MPHSLAPNADSARAGTLLVFADDWGRHPSSCQHLIAKLLPRYHVCWVNTIGMRTPRLNRITIQRAIQKFRPWMRSHTRANVLPNHLQVIDPKMWPWFSRSHDRWLNRNMLLGGLKPILNQLARPIVGITTLPIVADLIGPLHLDRWVYYCVDDFSHWPGLDHRAMATMEDDLIAQADRLIAASGTLQAHLAAHGKDSQLLTHGVDLEHWQLPAEDSPHAGKTPWSDLPKPLVVFWGLIDKRMDTRFVHQLADSIHRGTILLVGPLEHPDPDLLAAPHVVRLPAVDYQQLPRLAADAAALIMPYADLPVTRAMQPLKLKEYLATGKPVVARALPAIEAWADGLDAVASAEEFVSAVNLRIQTGLDPAQQAARMRLNSESWAAKAQQFEQWALTF